MNSLRIPAILLLSFLFFSCKQEEPSPVKTKTDIPFVNTPVATNIQVSSVTLNCSVNPNFLPTSVKFEYGPTTGYGRSVILNQNPIPGDSNENVNVAADLTGLDPGTTFHFRLKAENSLGITISPDVTFKTLGDLPVLTVSPVSNITSSSATIGALVNPNYLPTSIKIEIGEDTSYGNNMVITEDSLTGYSGVNISKTLTSLKELTIYHFKMKATNKLGTSTSGDIIFSTPGTLNDIDGNSYKTVIIGNQVWMAENLRTTHFSNGDPILNGENATNFCNGSAFYFRYNQDPNIMVQCGLLYNYYAASNSKTLEPDNSSFVPSRIQGACPTGWHLPSFAEYQILVDYLGGEETAGGKLKSMELWKSPNQGASNSSSFNALPSGEYDKLNYGYDYYGTSTFFWSSTGGPDYFRGLYLYYGSAQSTMNHARSRCNGAPVRCVRD